MDFDFAQVKEFFLEEALELFDKIDKILLSAENSGELTEEDINSLFRFFHTLKGNSATVDLKQSAKFTHELESFLSKLKNGEKFAFEPVISVLIDASDAVRKIILAEVDGILDLDEARALTQHISAALIGDFTSSEQLPTQKTKETVRAQQKESRKEQNQIKVDLSKIDFLMNSLGEIVITVSMLNREVEEMNDERAKPDIKEKISLLQRQLKEMQDIAMSIRMVPIRQIYSKFPKQVRDISKTLGKKVELVQIGDDVEIDKAITDGLTDAFGHLIRNSIDHGIEMPNERAKNGKSETATIVMEASQQNGQIVIRIKDDGRGIDPQKISQKAIEKGLISESEASKMGDEEKLELIFAAGFSTAEAITDISGRGVGMDVVRVNISKLGGSIRIVSEVGKYTAIVITLPLTLAVLDGLSVGVGCREFILPVAAISQTLQPQIEDITRITGGDYELLSLHDEFIPVVRVHRLFSIEPKYSKLEEGILLIVNFEDRKAALFVDEYKEEGQVAVRSLEKNFAKMNAFSAATVKADGSIGLILDVGGLLEMQKQLEKKEVA